MTCRICSNTESNARFDVREMMFGTREAFTYFQCARCGCLQIAEIPEDISRYYPSDYCSFNPSLERKFAGHLRKLFRLPRYRWAVLGKGFFGRMLHALSPKRKLRKLSHVGLTLDSRVLDVGCGTGSLLYTLRTIGLTHLLGVDAYIERDIEYPNGLRVLKRSIHDVSGTWDLVMFNYSLEHMPDQLETLRAAERLLSDDGTCLVQIPLVSSYAWEHYGVNWVQLDAPRHLYLHSAESFERLTGKAGFRIDRVDYDSDEFQFTGSERYVRDIPLKAPRSAGAPAEGLQFSRSEIRAFRKRAEQLNREKRGDQAAFYLKKA